MKKYVAVVCRYDEDGRMHPLTVLWDDGRRFDVERVLDVRRAASLKAGGTGIRYQCEILGRETHLYFEDPRWFVDACV